MIQFYHVSKIYSGNIHALEGNPTIYFEPGHMMEVTNKDDVEEFQIADNIQGISENKKAIYMLECSVEKLQSKITDLQRRMMSLEHDNGDGLELPNAKPEDVKSTYAKVTLNVGGKQVERTVPSDIAHRPHQKTG